MKMLFWKEWREVRGTILPGLLAIVLGGTLVFKLPGVLEPMAEGALFFFLFLYLFICGLVGGRLVAGETNRGTLPFLLSLPSSRVRIMAAKVLTSALPLLIFFLIVLLVLFKSFGEEVQNLPFSLTQLALFTLGLGLSYFASALFFSSFLDKTITAVIAGLALILLLSYIITSLPPSLEAFILMGISTFLVLVSFFIFARQEVK